MSVEIVFPLEFVVEGVPLSLRASRESKDKWKDQIVAAARAVLPAGHFLTEQPIAATIFYFPREDMVGHLDNIAKPILDALIGVVYRDDRQIERILLQKFEPHRLGTFLSPTPALVSALEGSEPMLYIRLDDELSRPSRDL